MASIKSLPIRFVTLKWSRNNDLNRKARFEVGPFNLIHHQKGHSQNKMDNDEVVRLLRQILNVLNEILEELQSKN
jgi:hypothetical protein